LAIGVVIETEKEAREGFLPIRQDERSPERFSKAKVKRSLPTEGKDPWGA